MNFRIALLTACLMFLGCSESHKNERESLSDKIIKDTIDDFLLDLVNAYHLEKAIFIHVEYEDFIKNSSLEEVLRSDIVKDSVEYKVVELLSKRISEKNTTKFEGFEFGKTNTIIENTTKNKKFFTDPNYFGTIVLSNAAIDPKVGLASYYLGVNCGKKCSSGFILIAEEKNTKWHTRNIILLWESK